MKTLNIGILAHVDAGKTSLTERLLFNAGAITHIGSVDVGNTQTDTLALERQRGITIKSAVASFAAGDSTINILDTPGHPDFIAEVERVLSVLDGAVLVVSAVEGVQAQTRILMRALQRLKIPTVIFVNKIDRKGARYESLLADIATKLSPQSIETGTVHNLGTPSASFVPYHQGDPDFIAQEELAAQTRQALAYPVLFGSAITGVGVEHLAENLPKLLPMARHNTKSPVSGTVFKIERSPAGEKIAFVRMFAGTLQVRTPVKVGQNDKAKVTALSVLNRGALVRTDSISAGQIGKLWGLANVRIGDTIGTTQQRSTHQFAPPTLESVIAPLKPSDKGALRVALEQLAEQDPLINLRQNDSQQELYVSLYGEVQKEVIQATLKNDFGIDVTFRETTTIYIERPAGSGSAVEILQDDANPYSATLGLRIDPAPAGSGVQFKVDVHPRYIPYFIYKNVGKFTDIMLQHINHTLQTGLHGWRVTDCIVTMDQCDYYVGDGMGKPSGNTPKTTAGDYRKLTPIVLAKALQKAKTIVCEPVDHFELDIPTSSLGELLPILAQHRAIPTTTVLRRSTYWLEGSIPTNRVHALQQRIPGLTNGEGSLVCSFDRYEPVAGGALPKK